MRDDKQATPHGTPAAPAPFKPALAPGVRPHVRLPKAPQPIGPGLATGPAMLAPGVEPPLGAPEPGLRATEPPPTPGVSGYKVPAPAPTQSGETIPVAHLVGSGLAAGVSITAAVLLFLKF